ncbi:MAG: hypothetical protein GY835_00610 [bacterium]|nr:hypothetical protein [bacterium]
MGGGNTRVNLSILVLMLTSLACASSLDTRERQEQTDYADINRRIGDSRTKVITAEGTLYDEVHRLRLSPETTTCAFGGFAGKSSLPTKEVGEIVILSSTASARAASAFKGFLFAGLIPACLLYWIDHEPPYAEVIFLYGLVTGSVGAVVGSVVGNKTEVVLNDSPYTKLKRYNAGRLDERLSITIDEVIRETDYLILARWKGKEIWLPRKAVRFHEVDNELHAAVPQDLYDEWIVGGNRTDP